MVENEYLSQNSNRKRIKQPVSIPFLWEEKPGTPKKDWKPSLVIPVNPIAQPPIKLVASVPFKWEEMPGKPLPCFTLAPQTLPLLLLPPPMLLNSHSPTVYSLENDDKWDVASAIDDDDNDADDDYECDGDDEEDEMFESYLDAWGFETDDSFSSGPSRMANRLIPTAAISNATPVQENFLMDSNSAQLQAPSSPTSDSDSSTSSYATGTTSLVGAPFLERLFPLLSPRSSFLEKVGCSEKNTVTPQMVLHSKDLDRETNCSLAVKRPLTLGELILMSQRRSYHRKAVLMRDQNLSVGLWFDRDSHLWMLPHMTDDLISLLLKKGISNVQQLLDLPKQTLQSVVGSSTASTFISADDNLLELVAHILVKGQCRAREAKRPKGTERSEPLVLRRMPLDLQHFPHVQVRRKIPRGKTVGNYPVLTLDLKKQTSTRNRQPLDSQRWRLVLGNTSTSELNAMKRRVSFSDRLVTLMDGYFSCWFMLSVLFFPFIVGED